MIYRIRVFSTFRLSIIHLGAERPTRSSRASLKALAINTTPRGTMVVYWPVGETLGTCWMQAVKRKNKLADRENSAALSLPAFTIAVCKVTHRIGIWAGK